MLKRLKGFLLKVLVLKKIYKKDREREFPLSFTIRLSAWIKGFIPESSVIYNFSENTPERYLNDFARLSKATSINGVNAILLDYKHLFSHLLANEKRVFQPDFYILKGKAFMFIEGKPIEIEDLFKMIHAEYVIKPTGGGGGAGILFMDARETPWKINASKYDQIKLHKLFESFQEVLMYKRINQSGFANKVNPGSLNTIRMLTMIDAKSQEAFLASAVFRCGVKKSGAVDNWSSGGLSVKINNDTGKMGKGVTFPYNGSLQWLSFHPDSNFPLEGTIVPDWKMMKDEVLALAQRYPFLPYIAWDVVPMESDFLILEANSNSDVNLLQVHEPLLTSTKVRAFYKHYDVI